MGMPSKIGRNVVLGLALALCSVPAEREAEACGGFFSARDLGVRRPSLSYEQALIVYDAKAEKEHFVREVTFDAAGGSFGFVVPTPTRPEVAKVGTSPFPALRTAFPFEITPPSTGGSGALGLGVGSGFGGRGVTVLEVKRIGKLTAFVLRADDPKELAAWLEKNRLVSTPEADQWLAHYVKMRFYYVAMRYDAPKPGAKHDAALTSETVRISFSSPAPYYPYFEPDPAKDAKPRANRLLDLWVVSTSPVVPVSTFTEHDTRAWVRPMRAGHASTSEFPTQVLDASLASLIPKGQVSVQTFSDQKVSRVGFGDIVFVPAAAQGERATQLARLKPMLGVLDTQIVSAP